MSFGSRQMYIETVQIEPNFLTCVPDLFKSQEMCNEAVRMEPCCGVEFVPDRLKTEDMCIEAVRRDEYTLGYVPDNLKTQEMCNEAVRNKPAVFVLVPNRFKA